MTEPGAEPTLASVRATDARTFAPATTELLRGQRQPVFAVLDAARDDGVLRLLRAASDAQFESLYDGPEGVQFAAAAPYLVRLPRSSALLGAIVEAAWGASWGVFATSDVAFAEVRRQLRRFLRVILDDGREVYFRFYDPRVLRVFLPTCAPTQAIEFFGPIQSFLIESATAQSALVVTRDIIGTPRVTEVPLVPTAATR